LNVFAILAAAGRGDRFGRRKQLLDLAGKPVVAWALESLADTPEVSGIVIACENDERTEFDELAERFGAGKVRSIVRGGPRRQDSVHVALRAVPATCDYVLVQDGARPFIDSALTGRVISAAARVGAAIAAVPVKDTIKLATDKDTVEGTVPRERLWAAQTPQVFSYATLLEAHRLAQADGFEATDDAALVERYQSTPIALIESSYENLKITTPDDLEVAARIAERLLATRR